jgi:putative ABC transport system permease protein
MTDGILAGAPQVLTPRQQRAAVATLRALPGTGQYVAAVIALPAGMIAQDAVVHAIARQQATLMPPGSLVHVYTTAGLTLLVLAGLAIAAIGALGPATWAATAKTTTALRAE